jgi:glycosyltransferase involved in cell wall biosynthesis
MTDPSQHSLDLPMPARPGRVAGLPLVSVITPNYNYGRFLEKCMRSVLCQSYPNLEYLIVDGGSTDESLPLIQRYAPCGITRWVSEKDDGQTDAINKGFAMASGQLFAWLNADDAYAHADVIQRVVDAYLQGARFISAEWNAIDEKGQAVPQGQGYGDLDPVDYAQCLRFWKHTCPTQPATFVTRELASAVFPLDPSIECYMDYQLFLGVLAQNPPCAWIQERWVDFVFHGGNKSLGNYSQAYDLYRESCRTFLESARHHLSPDAFRRYRREFEREMIVRLFPLRPLHWSFAACLRKSPLFLLHLAFWKAFAHSVLVKAKLR